MSGDEFKKKKKKNNVSSSKKKVKKSASVKKNGSGKPKTDDKAKKPTEKRKVKAKVKKAPAKSAMLQSIERQKRLEETMPISAFTSELPVLGRGLDSPSRRMIKKKAKKKKLSEYSQINFKVVLLVIGIILAIFIAILIVFKVYTVNTVIIEGNVHYSNDEIYNMVIGEGRLSKNSIYLSFKYKDKEIEDIPFIQTMTVKIVDPSTIRIVVYEKAVAGFVEYLGRYFYFDKDGTIIESSNVITKGIPQVMGLDFDHVVLYEKLPVESDDIFRQILEMTQLLDKYDIEMDKIYFDKSYNMTLYFDEARIKIGDFSNIDEKIIKLKNILPKLEGKKGVLRLDNYDGKDSIITFEMDE